MLTWRLTVRIIQILLKRFFTISDIWCFHSHCVRYFMSIRHFIIFLIYLLKFYKCTFKFCCALRSFISIQFLVSLFSLDYLFCLCPCNCKSAVIAVHITWQENERINLASLSAISFLYIFRTPFYLHYLSLDSQKHWF